MVFFGGVHILPFFLPIDGADAGFDPIDHTQVDARVGDWNDVKAMTQKIEIMADVIVNHMSAGSPQFQVLCRKRFRVGLQRTVFDHGRCISLWRDA